MARFFSLVRVLHRYFLLSRQIMLREISQKLLRRIPVRISIESADNKKDISSFNILSGMSAIVKIIRNRMERRRTPSHRIRRLVQKQVIQPFILSISHINGSCWQILCWEHLWQCLMPQ